MIYSLNIGSFEGMKSQNQSTILNLIRLKEPISRAEIAKLTKLTKPTVGALVSELAERNLITEEKSDTAVAGGRKPIMLRINYSAYYVVGVYAAAEVIRVILTTMDGRMVFDYKKDITELPSKEEFIEMIKSSISYVMEETNVEKNQILGIGFAMHGLVDPDNGIAIFSPHLHLEDIHLKEILEKEFSIPVIVENDVRALAIGESWFGQGQEISDFICISVGRGIGSGIVINNEIYKSSFNTAGEIGHTIVNINGPRCQCGNHGCLEAYASEIAIIDRARRKLQEKTDSVMTENELSIPVIFRAAKEGDELAKKILVDSGESLGIATANLINILKPTKIILEGSIFEEGDILLSRVRDMVQKYTIRSSKEEVSIVCSELGKKGMVLGAVALVLREMFKVGGLQ